LGFWLVLLGFIVWYLFFAKTYQPVSTDDLAVKLRQRVLREFLDLIIMCEFKNRSLSGFNALSYIHNKYDYLVSSGTVYSLLYAMERKGYITGTLKGKKRMFVLTSNGEEVINEILEANEGILGLVNDLIKIV
jgi:DNA-binding PadR family transcriptional regulator